MNTETQEILDFTLTNADPDWRVKAEAVVNDLIDAGYAFTATDVTAIAGQPDHPNRIGALLHHFSRAGRIVRVGFVESGRKSRHSGLIRVWQGVAA